MQWVHGSGGKIRIFVQRQELNKYGKKEKANFEIKKFGGVERERERNLGNGLHKIESKRHSV